MARFHYTGRNQVGKPVSGRRDAASPGELANALFQEGITPIDIVEAQEAISWTHRLEILLAGGRVETAELLMFARQMGTMTKAGIPIVTTVNRLADTSRSPLFVRILRAIAEKLAAGQDLAGSMRQYPKVFPPLVTNLVQVGERSGELVEAFRHISAYLELETKTRRQVKTALRYPTFVVVAIVVALLVINFMVIPAFAKMFANFGAELPLPTKILIASSSFLINNWVILLVTTIALSVAVIYYIHTKTGRTRWHGVKIRLPIIGVILRRIALGRFARLFALVLRAGIPLAEGLQLISKAVGNDYIAANLDEIRQQISRGEGLTRTAANSKLFSPLMLQMISVGEETGELDKMLDNMADFYEEEVDYALKRLGDTIEPVLLVFVGVMVLILALGVFLPMWDMASIARSR